MRLYEAIREHESDRVRISVRVLEKTSDDDNVIGGKPRRTVIQQLRYFLITRFRKQFPRKEFSSPNKTYRSQCLHHSGLGNELNNGPWDMAVLHWLGDKTLSIEETGALRIPYMWHLHDMWLFSGADHTSTDRRYAEAYSPSSRSASESGPDINREVFRRKLRSWHTSRHMITPSTWLAAETRLSPLTASWPVSVIPNPVDVDFWQPIDPQKARKELGISPTANVFLFGAYAGANAIHKGPDIFFDALKLLADHHGDHHAVSRIHVLLFGKHGGVPDNLPFPTTHLGPISDDELLTAYGASTVAVVPSRVESFGQIASEANACGRPVIATRVGGLVDIVVDNETGKLIPPDDPDSLAQAMLQVIESPNRSEKLGKAARQRAEDLWSPARIAKQYVDALLRDTKWPT